MGLINYTFKTASVFSAPRVQASSPFLHCHQHGIISHSPVFPVLFSWLFLNAEQNWTSFCIVNNYLCFTFLWDTCFYLFSIFLLGFHLFSSWFMTVLCKSNRWIFVFNVGGSHSPHSHSLGFVCLFCCFKLLHDRICKSVLHTSWALHHAQKEKPHHSKGIKFYLYSNALIILICMLQVTDRHGIYFK